MNVMRNLTDCWTKSKKKAVFFIDDSDFNIEDIGYCKNRIHKEPNIGFNGYRIFGSHF